MASSKYGCASTRRPLSLETRVFRIRRAHANPSYGRRYSSQHARRLLSRLEADVTLCPGFLVPAAIPRVRSYAEDRAPLNQHATGNSGRRDPNPNRCHKTPEKADFPPIVRQRIQKMRKKGLRSISKPPEPCSASKLRVSWSHVCPGEDCVEFLCDLDVEPSLEDIVPCASTGRSTGAFIDYEITGLGSHALPSPRLVDALHISALNAGLDDSTVQKIVTEILPPSSGVAFGKDARDLLIECCVEFITLISSEANEISEKEAKKTIACEHITKALEQLGFSEYVADILDVANVHKEQLKGREKKANKLEQSGLSTEQLLAMQEAAFKDAAERHG
ncbi:hypothetical protein VE03_06963 [Pseudogymnoascus sp. 23342-1-I1]|nr:hypothetical protein VE03_06963 [Pseudogymnoascus sp. 23342-1-I1]